MLQVGLHGVKQIICLRYAVLRAGLRQKGESFVSSFLALPLVPVIRHDWGRSRSESHGIPPFVPESASVQTVWVRESKRMGEPAEATDSLVFDLRETMCPFRIRTEGPDQHACFRTTQGFDERTAGPPLLVRMDSVAEIQEEYCADN